MGSRLWANIVIRPSDHEAAVPVGFTNGDQLDVAVVFAQQLRQFLEKLLLVVARNVSVEGAVLCAVQAIIQAGVGNLGADAIIGDVVDEEAIHFMLPMTSGE